MRFGNTRRLVPSPAMVVALIALISGLAGTAVALQGRNSVKSSDIAPGNVRSSDIDRKAVKGSRLAPNSVDSAKLKPGAVSSRDMDFFRAGGAFAAVTTTSGAPVDLGGPRVTVTVPPNGLVGVYARVRADASGGGGNGAAQVHLHEPKFLPRSPRIIEVGKSGGASTRYTAPGTGDVDGTGSPTRGGMLILAPPPGTYTFSLRYSGADGARATFEGRNIWAGVIN
jgi:hypothetical protein